MEPNQDHWKLKIDFRMLSVLLLIAVIPFLLGTWWLFSGYQQASLEAQGASLADESEMAFHDINAYLGNQIIEIAGLTEVPVLRASIEAKNLDLNRNLDEVRKEIIAIAQRWRTLDYRSPELQAVLDNPASDFLRRYTALRSSYREIIITDFLGRTVAATGKTSDYHHANDAWWKEAYSDGQKGGVYIGDIHYQEGARTYSFEIAQPFVNPKGGVMGVIMVSIDTQEINALVDSLRSSFGGTAALVRTDGSVISTPGYAYLNQRPFAATAEILNSKEKGKRYVISQSDPRIIYGISSQSLTAMYPHLKWVLTISNPVQSVIAPLTHLRRNIVILILAVTGGTLLVALWLSRVESKPLLIEDAHLEQL